MKPTVTRRNSRRLIILILACASSFVTSLGAFAATFTVTNTSDSGSGSLRQAVLDSNSAAGTDNIVFDASFNTPQTITLTTGDIVFSNSVNANVTITGPGANLLTVSGNNNSKIFSVLETPVVNISGMTLTGGNGVGVSPGNNFGGAIYNQGVLTLTDMVITANSATQDGGGVYCSTSDTLTVDHCVVSNNSADIGGGIYGNDGATVTVTSSTITGNHALTTSSGGGGITCDSITFTMNDSTVSDNTSGNWGGGLEFDVDTNVMIARSTISGNTATALGGGFHIQADSNTLIQIENSTVSGNLAAVGAGIYREPSSALVVTLSHMTVASNTATNNGGGAVGTMNVGNSIIGNNSDNGTAPDYSGTLNSQGYNLIENVTGSTITGDTTGNITGQDPLLGALANYGGATETHSLLAGSPALDSADPVNFPATDQRGIDRPRDGDGNGSLLPDIGAFERVPGSLQFSSADYSVAENVAGGTATITVTRLDGLDTEVSVDYATSDGTAVAGQDYQPASGTLVFAAGVSSETFDVQIIDNSISEPDETVNLTLSNPNGGGSLGIPTMAILTIEDNDIMTGSLILTGAASRKTHGSSGNFELPLILDPAGSGTVEPRTDGPTTLILTFSDNVVASDGTIDGNEFAIMNASFAGASSTGNQITLNLTNVIDQSVVSVALSGIESNEGTALSGDNDVEIRALLGDANQDRIVDRADIASLRAHRNQNVDEDNFVLDLDLNGTVGPHDGRIVRGNKLHTVP
jgi:predicted outer membrane repeat protein